MISPYILRYATTEATAERIRYFLRDCFHICQRELPEEQRSVLMACDCIWDFENNTCFPLFIRRGYGFCDLVTDPLAPAQKNLFENANFLTDVEDRRYLLRLERPLNPPMREKEETLSKSVLRSLRGWYQQHDLTQSADCAAIQIEKCGFCGVVDPRGNVLVPPLYKSIVPFSVRLQEIALFVCYRGDKFTNTVDVYDINGNKIYENIGGLYLHTEEVKYAFSGEDGNAPGARFAETLRVVQYTQPPLSDKAPPYKEYIRKVSNLRLLPVAEKDDGPRRLARFSDALSYDRNIETIDLRDIHDVLYPLAEKMGAYHGETAAEIMLSIPHWNFFRKGHTRMDAVVPDLPLHLLLDMPENIRMFFENIGLKTVTDVANTDLTDFCNGDRSLEFAVFLFQAQIQYTLAHPAEDDEQET